MASYAVWDRYDADAAVHEVDEKSRREDVLHARKV